MALASIRARVLEARIGRFHQIRVGDALLDRGDRDSRAQRLPEQEHVARPGPRVRQDTARVHQTGHGQAVLGLEVVDAVTAHDGAVRLAGDLRSTR
jgi:hypothetical protein